MAAVCGRHSGDGVLIRYSTASVQSLQTCVRWQWQRAGRLHTLLRIPLHKVCFTDGTMAADTEMASSESPNEVLSPFPHLETEIVKKPT